MTWANTAARTLGVGASGWRRAVVAGVLALAYLPAVVSVGVPVLLERYVHTADTPIAIERIRDLALDPTFVPRYWQYFEITAAVVVVFTALVGPSATTEDRADGMLGVYVRSPLGAHGYVLAKWLATVSVLLLVTTGPLLLLLVGNVLAGDPRDASPALAGRLLVAGVVVAAVHAAISVGVGLLARTRGEAAVSVALALVGVSALVSVVRADGGPAAAGLADPHRLVLETGSALVGAVARPDAPGLATGIGVAAAWTAAWLVVAVTRSRTLAARP